MENLKQVQQFLATEEAQIALGQLLTDLQYHPATHGENPLLFALQTLMSRYGEMKQVMAISEMRKEAEAKIKEGQAQLDAINNDEITLE